MILNLLQFWAVMAFLTWCLSYRLKEINDGYEFVCAVLTLLFFWPVMLAEVLLDKVCRWISNRWN